MIEEPTLEDDDVNAPADYAEPEWDKANRVHDWRNHVGERVRKIWSTFTLAQRAVLAANAEDDAGKEEWD